MKVYNTSVNYLKALGISLMVLGHSGIIDHEISFIYMFHMPLFFIASGYCFKEKYLSAPRKYIYNKVKGIYWPYVKWSLLFLFCCYKVVSFLPTLPFFNGRVPPRAARQVP